MMTRSRVDALLALALAALAWAGCAGSRQAIAEKESGPHEASRGVHFFSPGKQGLPLLKRAIVEQLAPIGVNTVVLEVNYGFEYQSHPELRWEGAVSASPDEGAISKAEARELVALCRQQGIRLIPQFNCLGHQSWRKTLFPLLVQYPEMDETPADTPAKYCRSWCPLHPEVNPIVFDLMDELIDAFQADTFHVGMDEVFLIADEQCPRCKGKNPAQLFAKAVNDYHRHLVGKRGVTMLMWGDRLLDAEAMGYSKWEASSNGTAPAIDLIPKDIVICDWHYGRRDEYLSVPYFLEKGFRVWPSSWKDADAARALLEYSRSHATERMIGHLCTTWYGPDVPPAILGEAGGAELNPEAVKAAETIRACMKLLTSPQNPKMR